jgi:hypothetical protein
MPGEQIKDPVGHFRRRPAVRRHGETGKQVNRTALSHQVPQSLLLSGEQRTGPVSGETLKD